MTSFSLSLTHTHIHLLSHDENLYLQHTTLSSMYFFFALLLFCLSLSLCRFLPVPFVQEKEVQRVDKLFTPSMHLCMFFFLRLRALFFFYILSIFLFFSSFCNRQNEVKNKKNALNTYVVSRTMRPSVTRDSLTIFRPFFFFFYFFLSF